jgi:hypothetical protein
VSGTVTSWQLSKLVFADRALDSLDATTKLTQKIFRVRAAFQQLAAQVNDIDEKWTVVGRHRLGEVGEDKEISETVKTNFIKVFPTSNEPSATFRASDHVLTDALVHD